MRCWNKLVLAELLRVRGENKPKDEGAKNDPVSRWLASMDRD